MTKDRNCCFTKMRPIMNTLVLGICCFLTAVGSIAGDFAKYNDLYYSDSCVSIVHKPDATYDMANDMVKQVITQLNIGVEDNPLQGIIKKGDRVLIKPSLFMFLNVTYTEPAVVKPLVEMAIKAGASKVWVGDGGGDYLMTEEVMEKAGYNKMIAELQKEFGSSRVELVNLNNLHKWRWVNVQDTYLKDYTDDDLSTFIGMGDEIKIKEHKYYKTPDHTGKIPQGVKGWYAISEYVLDSDVLITVPKLKTHSMMIMTGAMKILVGITEASTYSAISPGCLRVPHFRTGSTPYDKTFGNDVLAKAIWDLNHIAIYADKNGHIQTKPQRKYLSVIDGIACSEVSEQSGKSYNLGVIAASQDPVALDTVCAGLMGYNYTLIPTLRNCPFGKTEGIDIIGNKPKLTHVFEFCPDWSDYAEGLSIYQSN